MKAMVDSSLKVLRPAWRRARPYLPAAAALCFVACAQFPLQMPTADPSESKQSVVSSDLDATTAGEPQTELSAVEPTAQAATEAEVIEVADSDIVSDAVAPATAESAVSPTAEGETKSMLALMQTPEQRALVDALCVEVGNKLGSVSVEDCHRHEFQAGEMFSVKGRPLLVKDLLPRPGYPDFRVLIMGGIHGDEYSSISILFKWLDLYSRDGLEGEFLWRFAPLVNPDGLLEGTKASRQNANGVDLNRNFPSQDWNDSAVSYWRKSTGSNPRRYPGEQPASEPEVQWLVQQIDEFQPHVIVSLHAPYHLLDFDGPAAAPERIGELQLRQLGVYPGSLGNYAGLNKLIPVVTLELPSAGSLPAREQITLMWRDLVAWLDREGRKGLVD